MCIEKDWEEPGDEAREEGRLTDQLSQLAKIFVLSLNLVPMYGCI